MIGEKIQTRCALYGKTLLGRGAGGGEEKEKVMVIEEVVDGSHYLFDTEECAIMFKKFGLVYGNNFYADLCEMPQS
jgi:hypothetical protein